MTVKMDRTMGGEASTALVATLEGLVEKAEPIVLDGSEVEQIGLAGLQVLQSGRLTAQSAGVDFRVDSPSAALSEMAMLAGFDDLLHS